MKDTGRLSDIYTFQYGKGNDNPDNGGIYPVYGSNGIIGGYDQYNNEDSPVIGHIGANAGSVVFAKGKHFVTYNGVMCKIKEGADRMFGYYALLASNIKQIAFGSAQPFVSYNTLNRIGIFLPTIEKQKKISHILLSYDNLIETNNKRIKVLEQMAENLYKEWFVRFRFPGHETVKFENGFPTTWKRAKIADLATFQNGFAFKSEDYDEKGRYVVVTIKNVQDGYFDLDSIERIDFLPSRMPKYCMLKKGDVIMSLTGNVGRVCIVSADSCLLNQRVCRIESKYSLFAYMFFKQEAVFQLLCNIAYGTAQLNLSPILAGRMKTVLPPDDLMAQFNNKVSGLFSAIQQYREQNDNLIRQRDLLLPRLMSGKLEV